MWQKTFHPKKTVSKLAKKLKTATGSLLSNPVKPVCCLPAARLLMGPVLTVLLESLGVKWKKVH
jgi:hypothetical protein